MSNRRRTPLTIPVIIVAGVCLFGLLVVVPAIALLAGAGGGSEPDESTLIVDQMDFTIEIVDFKFEQSNVSVPRGARVTWLNAGNAPHDATERDKEWQTDILEESDSETLTFDRPANYDYYCSVHPGMEGKLTVR
jgi:plastocyanin